MLRTNTCGELRKSDAGKEVTLCGWVAKKRNLGSICFIDLRDRYGVTQLAFDEEHSPLTKDLRNEYVLQVKGVVNVKSEANTKIPTGEIEILVSDLKVLSKAKTTPMIIADETDALEDTRLRYRYLDIRRAPIYKNLLLRDKVMVSFRETLHGLGFTEVETPILSKSTPEGARDYLVPSRLYEGKFYALPQSPQIYKQLLMIGGMDRYFQIARCFRDEDLRADRQPEFTQIDIEMSFAEEEDIFAVVENCMRNIFKEIKGIEDLSFPRITYREAMASYGSDKPDLRFGYKLVDCNDLFADTEFSVFRGTLDNGGKIKALKLDQNLSRKELDHYGEFIKIYGAKGLANLKFNDGAFSGSIAKFLTPAEEAALKERFELKGGETILFIADEQSVAETALGALRVKIGHDLKLIDENKYCFAWITEFPMYEWSKERQRYESAHHPFTAPKAEDVDKMLTDKGNCYSRAYDLVLNGYELLSGSVRIHDQEMQAKVFEALGLSPEKAKERFGFFLEAFQYGTPPHCGVGIGLERLIMILCGTDNIKDVVAFPKTQSAMDLMADAPSGVDQEQLDDLYLAINPKKK
ncbi:MAG: aspartate--tRNA ligase [Erysipelotrichaceae bacterium]|nr:aspartate--tRNA ligase [Erysipelotrichaceae bacterium]